METVIFTITTNRHFTYNITTKIEEFYNLSRHCVRADKLFNEMAYISYTLKYLYKAQVLFEIIE